ncbi:fumarate reductase/succinate dehydrogenase flavoprotein subunit [Nocardioides sp. cx-173]|uniref:fumarate reductase/succinate dehydrogenase flavoprotein subunit n=1 Tax=Nocardioides sp. cx-173 TaxID=2898796 RepID=UPI001E369AD4|nr:fumarate reductase/succinate dehydrogenase flavoprotein subunit [Nocardioides sp. cx-173]MCD4524568.1 fumarate reductase/succinate dehydrogenase flavoprotein subunit [Nocardioides sp. cx-173]UGB42947.1 fumarate reductase/succinate dehydrogenase flavoprotein subunit [Nocardioides sp. cx-173]
MSTPVNDRHPMTGNEMSGEAAGGMERHTYDVVVVGAGGAGLRAAIAAHEAGARTALVCKSLLGKAHTVMAEGGIAAAMANRWPEDNWEVHFRDTMRGGKMLNNWRMAQLHAQEAPERVMELEDWGALFDRTDDGLISQRDFGGHKYARLAHVGDRTGLEMIRTLQQRAVSLGIDVFMECTVTEILLDEGAGGAVAGAFAYWRETGRFVLFETPSVILATGGIGKSFKVTSNSWEYTGDGHALAMRSGASLINMEFVQFHPTGMVWPPSVKGLLVTESVRGDGGILKNSEGERFMFDYIPEYFKSETADTVEEADRWYEDKANNRRPPELLPRDEVARAINSEIKAGRGTPHGGIYLDIASRRSREFIRKRLPSMYHQFKELADVDITAEPMEIGPTCHYVMGGVEVDADTQESSVTGLYAVGECSGGMHGSNRLGGNSLGDLLVFGKRAGEAATAYVNALRASGRDVVVDERDVKAAEQSALAPFEVEGGENPYTIQSDLQQSMNDLVGIIRTAPELERSLSEIEAFKVRAASMKVEGHRQYNPGWHLALDLRNMLIVSECIAKAALAREESRGGHTRDDFPGPDEEWATKNLVVNLNAEGTGVDLYEKPLPVMPDELQKYFEPATAEPPAESKEGK